MTVALKVTRMLFQVIQGWFRVCAKLVSGLLWCMVYLGLVLGVASGGLGFIGFIGNMFTVVLGFE